MPADRQRSAAPRDGRSRSPIGLSGGAHVPVHHIGRGRVTDDAALHDLAVVGAGRDQHVPEAVRRRRKTHGSRHASSGQLERAVGLVPARIGTNDRAGQLGPAEQIVGDGHPDRLDIGVGVWREEVRAGVEHAAKARPARASRCPSRSRCRRRRPGRPAGRRDRGRSTSLRSADVAWPIRALRWRRSGLPERLAAHGDRRGGNGCRRRRARSPTPSDRACENPTGAPPC